jgi:ribosomal protein S18 acetylase RimI-like enzyme
LASERIRHSTSDDLRAVLDLWRSAGAKATVTDSVERLSALLLADPGALLVADIEGAVVGTLIVAWDGWRGSFYRLAVHPEHRRRGLATRLVRQGEVQLRERGAIRLSAIVAGDEPSAPNFWSAAGYTRQAQRLRFVRNF